MPCQQHVPNFRSVQNVHGTLTTNVSMTVTVLQDRHAALNIVPDIAFVSVKLFLQLNTTAEFLCIQHTNKQVYTSFSWLETPC